MKFKPFHVVLAAALLTAGCVRRTVTSRPGYTNPATDELMEVTPTYEKTVEERIIWFWEDDFRNPAE